MPGSRCIQDLPIESDKYAMTTGSKSFIVAEAGVRGQDRAQVSLEMNSDIILQAKVSAVGCLAFLQAVEQLRNALRGPLALVRWSPSNNRHVDLLMNEIVLRLQQKWNAPHCETELCHCRRIPRAKVDEAIICGAKSAAEVALLTSAGTGCGSCRPRTEDIIAYRRTA